MVPKTPGSEQLLYHRTGSPSTQKPGEGAGDLLDALIRPAFVLILHDATDKLVILLQELKDQRKGQRSATSRRSLTCPSSQQPSQCHARPSCPGAFAESVPISLVPLEVNRKSLMGCSSLQEASRNPQPSGSRLSSPFSPPALALTCWIVS